MEKVGGQDTLQFRLFINGKQRWETVGGKKEKVKDSSTGQKIARADLISFLKSSLAWTEHSVLV